MDVDQKLLLEVNEIFKSMCNEEFCTISLNDSEQLAWLKKCNENLFERNVSLLHIYYLLYFQVLRRKCKTNKKQYKLIVSHIKRPQRKGSAFISAIIVCTNNEQNPCCNSQLASKSTGLSGFVSVLISK